MERDAVIVAGFGFRTGVGEATLAEVLAQARGVHRVAALAAPQDKAPALVALAGQLGLPVIAVEAAAMAGVDTPTQSPKVQAARGVGSVAEAAALAAAGPGARIIVGRVISADRRATCALAEGTGQ